MLYQALTVNRKGQGVLSDALISCLLQELQEKGDMRRIAESDEGRRLCMSLQQAFTEGRVMVLSFTCCDRRTFDVHVPPVSFYSRKGFTQELPGKEWHAQRQEEDKLSIFCCTALTVS